MSRFRCWYKAAGLPTKTEWWFSFRWVFGVFTALVALAILGSFFSYEAVVVQGHPWLPTHQCPGCPFCGMTRSFCAMSSGRWQQAFEWNKGGPPLYGFFWVWLLMGFTYSLVKSVFRISGFSVQLVSILTRRTQPRRCSASGLLDVRHLGGKGGEQKND